MSDQGSQPGITVVSRQRVPTRSRESAVTISSWRVELALPDGERGAIVMVEPWYRGEGALLGSSQEQLAKTWAATIPGESSDPEIPQYG